MIVSLAYLYNGYEKVGFQHYSLGYIHLPAFFALGITSFIFTPIGVKLSKVAPQHILKPIYRLYLFAVGAYLFV